MNEKTPDTTEIAEKAVDEKKVMRIQVVYINPDGTEHSRAEPIIVDWPASDEESTGRGE